MKPIVIRSWEAWIGLVLSLIIMGFALHTINTGFREWTVWAAMAIGVFSFVVCFLGVNHTDTFSEEGITCDGLFGKKTIPWSDVIQVRSFWIERSRRGSWKTHSYKHLGFTFKGGTPMRLGQNPTLWMLKNLNTCVSVPYREDLEKLALQCYGPLDDKVFWSPSNQ